MKLFNVVACPALTCSTMYFMTFFLCFLLSQGLFQVHAAL